MVLSACAIVFLANLVLVFKILKLNYDNENSSKSLLALSIGFILYAICCSIYIISVEKFITLENMYLLVMGEPLKGLGWAYVNCIFGWFATIFLKLTISLYLCMAYWRSFFKMRAILTNAKPYPVKYLDAFKWLVLAVSFGLCLTLCIMNFFWYNGVFT
jgi:hypothetical protein